MSDVAESEIEQRFINGVWEVLQRDSNDLRKQQAILRLFRAARDAPVAGSATAQPEKDSTQT